jgi:hypothetical protein
MKKIIQFIVVTWFVSFNCVHAALINFATIFPSLHESQSITDATDLSVDPSMLTLKYDHNVSVFFISEGAGYKNSFGWYNAANDPLQVSNRNIVWNNASGTGPGLRGGGSLNMGDSVQLGNISAGTTLGFFITSNGFYRGVNGNHFYTNAIYNADNMHHVIAGVYEDLGLIALGFEDMWGGGDKDYNDLLVAVDVGIANTRQLVGATDVPTPTTFWLFAIALCLVAFSRRLAASHSQSTLQS